jgi:hypothetical protein
MLEWNKKEAPLKALAGMGGGVGRGPIGGGNNDQYHLVWSMSQTGSGSVVSNYTTHDFDALTEGQTGVNFTSYSDIPTGWDRLYLTSKNRGTVWVFENNANSRIWLASLCNPYSSWVANNNTRYTIYPFEGSSRYATTLSSRKELVFQHNNGGNEAYDIPTLGNTGSDVWNGGMYWGNIDAYNNYGGFMNHYNDHQGSGGSATGDTLYAYVKYNHSTTTSDYTNYLTPTGPLGNAQNMSWSYSGTTGLAGNPNRLADTVDRNTAHQWDSYGFQQQASGGGAWIQVDLGAGNETSFDFTFALGYPSGTHDSNENYVAGSNDNSTWEYMAEWRTHNNNLTTDYNGGYLFNNNGAWVYSDALNYMGIWHAIKNRTAYRYWRIGGTAFNWASGNNHQLIMNWALLKKT